MPLDTFEPRTLPLARAPALGAGEAHVWRMRLANLPVMETEAPSRRADAVRQRRMGQRFVLRLLLGAYLSVPGRDVALTRAPSGKPALADPHADSGLRFNVSHAGDLFAVVVARDVEVGIDIEPRDRAVRAAALARRWFTGREADLITALDEAPARDAFLRRWSAREAVIKACGGTIAEHVGDVQPRPHDPARLARVPAGWPPADRWDVREITADPDAFGFLAAPAPIATVTGFALALTELEG
jgi:4'-phosphopantetheinyl transferase